MKRKRLKTSIARA